jgi:NAD(P)-dependent dehydrogenase (short-subunit alcohol dehydrogenase family)
MAPDEGSAGAACDRVEHKADEDGSEAHIAALDALDECAVDGFADDVAARAGGIDVCFNLISHGDVQGIPMVEMELEDFMRPIDTAVRSIFITARAAARHMIPKRNGAIPDVRRLGRPGNGQRTWARGPDAGGPGAGGPSMSVA